MDNRQITTPQGSPTPVLVFGIISLALCETGILGLIFAIIALVKAKNYVNTYGPISTKVTVGRRLAIAGLIVSICFIVFWALFCTLIVVGVVKVASDPEASKTLKDLSDYLQNYTYSY